MAADSRAPQETAAGLRRVIGPHLLLFLVVGDILGTGIYALIGSVAGRIGGALWLPFLLAFVVALLTALSYLELVSKYPRAAGAALYTQLAFGVRFLTFMVAFAVMASGVTSAASAATAFGETYLAEFLRLPLWLVGFVFLLGLGLVNFRGVGESVRANVVLTAVEVSGLLIVIAVGVWAVAHGVGEPARLVQFPPAGSGGWTAITAATSLAFFAMVGFEDSVNLAEETRDPGRNFPRAILLGMTVTGVIYLVIAGLAATLLTASELAAEGSGALLRVLQVGAPGFPLKVFAGIGLIAVINSALLNMLMASRLLYGMANEGIIPRPFGAVHRRRRTPWVAIAFSSLVAYLLVLTSNLGLLGGTTSLLLLAVFTIVNVAVLVLRRNPVAHAHFRAPTWAPVLGVLTCGYLATPLSGRPTEQFVVAGVLLAIGAGLWAVNRVLIARTRPAGPPSPDDGTSARS